jgi:hypothetical protein
LRGRVDEQKRYSRSNKMQEGEGEKEKREGERRERGGGGEKGRLEKDPPEIVENLGGTWDFKITLQTEVFEGSVVPSKKIRSPGVALSVATQQPLL